jgi:hypothetical protein
MALSSVFPGAFSGAFSRTDTHRNCVPESSIFDARISAPERRFAHPKSPPLRASGRAFPALRVTPF